MKKISKSKKRWVRNFILAFILISALGFASLAYFFVHNDAPILKGEVLHHIEYKHGLKLDIYLPLIDKYELSPTLIYFHGGAWIAGSKKVININRYNRAINQLRASGYTVVAADYTLARDGISPFPNCIVDGIDALKWVEDHAAMYKLDINNIGVFGESAGAHLSMMVAYADHELFTNSPSQSKLRYVIDVYGPNDLYQLYRAPNIDSLSKVLDKIPLNIGDKLQIASTLFGFDPAEDSIKTYNFAMLHSPITYLDEKAPPTLMIHGTLDRIVPIQQTFTIKSKMDSLKIENKFHPLQNTDHAFRGAIDQQKDSIQTWIIDFVLQHYVSE
ncbi:MAG: alpha/beta hydrolase [Reichenbachiella sp.]